MEIFGDDAIDELARIDALTLKELAITISSSKESVSQDDTKKIATIRIQSPVDMIKSHPNPATACVIDDWLDDLITD